MAEAQGLEHGVLGLLVVHGPQLVVAFHAELEPLAHVRHDDRVICALGIGHEDKTVAVSECEEGRGNRDLGSNSRVFARAGRVYRHVGERPAYCAEDDAVPACLQEVQQALEPFGLVLVHGEFTAIRIDPLFFSKRAHAHLHPREACLVQHPVEGQVVISVAEPNPVRLDSILGHGNERPHAVRIQVEELPELVARLEGLVHGYHPASGV